MNVPPSEGGQPLDKDKKTGIKVNDLYEMITKVMTPEEALKKLLSSSLINYEKLKFNHSTEAIHPELVIIMAMMDLGWGVAIENNKEQVEGLTIGTPDYLQRTLRIKNGLKEGEDLPKEVKDV